MKEIPLTQGQIAYIDDEDFELISQYKWCAHWRDTSNSYYAVTNARNFEGKSKTLSMHRLIMDAPQHKLVDHINHNTLDNRRQNMRICTKAQNAFNMRKPRTNTSGIKGISQAKDGKWYAYIMFNQKARNLGGFSKKEDAANAYRKEAEKLFGEFACTE